MADDRVDIARMFSAGQGAATFLGFPACQSPDEVEAEIAILGAPCASPYRSVGAYCAGAPAAIRDDERGSAARSNRSTFRGSTAPSTLATNPTSNPPLRRRMAPDASSCATRLQAHRLSKGTLDEPAREWGIPSSNQRGRSIEQATRGSVSGAVLGLVEGRDEIKALLRLHKDIDLVIPRGSNHMVQTIMNSTRIPTFSTTPSSATLPTRIFGPQRSPTMAIGSPTSSEAVRMLATTRA